MQVALCTTTINIPHVLKLYRACSETAEFFVAGDLKTPKETWVFCGEIKASAISPPAQAEWKCSELIGWNCIQRRNIAFLEALKWGADVVISTDDDNVPVDTDYFAYHENALGFSHDGLSVGDCAWFDVGQHLTPPARQRGFPQSRYPNVRYAQCTDMKVGVNAGICLGDPDVSAVDRMSQAPFVYGVTEFLRAGLVVRPHTWAPFNSQNTAILRQFVPAWGMVPFVGRFDDIFASLVAQRVMWEHGHVVRFGQPMIFQERNQHDLIKDLRAEIDGYDHVTKWTNVLDQIVLKGKSVIEDTRQIWQTLGNAHFVPKEAVAAMLAYVDDCETVL